MKRFQLTSLLLIAILLLTACGAPTQAAQTQEQQPPAATETQTPAAPSGKLVSSNGMEFVIPIGLGTDASGTIVPEVVDQMDEFPAYLEFTLQGYTPTTEYSKPQIRVISVQELAKNNQGQDTLLKLRALLANPVTNPSPDAQTMPSSDKFANVVAAANLMPLSLSGISGVRMLVGFGGMAVAPMSSDMVMYQFQGLTADGQFYVAVRMPLSVPFLSPDGKAPVPADGVQFSADAYEAYTKQISERLAAAEAANTLSPSIALMDVFVQSLKINSAGVILPTPMPASVATEQPTLVPTATAVTACIDSASLVSEDPQDGAKFNAGEVFRKTWNLVNTGTCTWDANYQLIFVEGEQMASAGLIKPLAANTVAPGGPLGIWIDMVAPTAQGEHVGKWSWNDGAGKSVPISFSGVVSSVITVKIKTKQSEAAKITNVVTSIVQEQGSGTICTAKTTYFVYVNITADGPTTAKYRIDLTDASGQVSNGTFDSVGSPEAKGSLVFDAAGTLPVNLRVIGPYSYADAVTVRAYVNDQSWPAVTVSCK